METIRRFFALLWTLSLHPYRTAARIGGLERDLQISVEKLRDTDTQLVMERMRTLDMGKINTDRLVQAFEYVTNQSERGREISFPVIGLATSNPTVDSEMDHRTQCEIITMRQFCGVRMMSKDAARYLSAHDLAAIALRGLLKSMDARIAAYCVEELIEQGAPRGRPAL